MSIPALLKGKGPTGFGYGSTTDQVTEGLDLSGKRYLVTGCNSGLGAETTRVLVSRGATVIGAARTLDKATAATAAHDGHAEPLACELSDPASVRAAVTSVLEGAPLDGIIANAGIMALPKLEQAHGHELQFFTNHVGHFVLVTGLLEHLTEDARVVMLSSSGHRMTYDEGIQFDNLSGEGGYSSWKAYGQSKLANVLFARSLAARFEGTQRTANAVHPGVIATNLARHMNRVVHFAFGLVGPAFMKSTPQGAATQVYVATHPDAAAVSGEYWADCNIAPSSAHGRDMALAERLWSVTEEIVGALP